MSKSKNPLIVKFHHTSDHPRSSEHTQDRVKCLSFHSKRPLLLASYHDGRIQLWDYRSEVLVDTFHEHSGSVRAVHFHPTQPLFVSGGDDCIIRVWNYQERRCIFTLQGHSDYIRSVQFHHHYPWILSAGDDRTIRLWNWQSRSSVACLSGHSYYVMSAKFHPSKDLIVSASLDCTVRIWDVSGLTQKTVSISHPQSPSSDIFALDVEVKHVLEGHTKGVNWAQFHPTLPLIVSGADDHEVKVWRMGENRAWLVDSLQGHTRNVSAAAFHPTLDLIISNSEDMSLRIWDVNKRVAPTVVYREDKFWTQDVHPTSGLVAAGHDYGFMIFKLMTERPPMATHTDYPDNVFAIMNNTVCAYNLQGGSNTQFSLTRQASFPNVSPIHLHVQTSGNSLYFLVQWSDDKFDMFTLAKPASLSGAVGNVSHISDAGKSAVFASSNRFAVLLKDKTVHLRTLGNETKRKIGLSNVTGLFPCAGNKVLIRCTDSVVLYDIQACRSLGELRVSQRHDLKAVSWSACGKYVALICKSILYLASSNMKLLTQVSESQKIKGAIWHDGVVIYLTHTHIRYALTTGESGPLCFIDNTLYPILAKHANTGVAGIANVDLYSFNKTGEIIMKSLNPLEFAFRQAIRKRKVGQVTKLIASGALVGSSLIDYATNLGYPELALLLEKNIHKRFKLAIAAGILDIAKECAAEINTQATFASLAKVALQQGDLSVAESCYLHSKGLAELALLYRVTNNPKLAQISQIIKQKGDRESITNFAVVQQDKSTIVSLLEQNGYHAYAKSVSLVSGLEVKEDGVAMIAPNLVNLSLVTGKQRVSLQDLLHGSKAPSHALPSVQPVFPGEHTIKDWPMLQIKSGFLTEAAEEDSFEAMDTLHAAPVSGANAGSHDWEEDKPVDALEQKDEFQEAAGFETWELDEDFGDDIADAVVDPQALPPIGEGVLDVFLRNAKSASAKVLANTVAGKLDQALMVMKTQMQITRFEPFKDILVKTALFSSLQVPTIHTATLPAYVHTHEQPHCIITPASVTASLNDAYAIVSKGQLQASKPVFLQILYSFVLLPQDAQRDKLLRVIRNYQSCIYFDAARQNCGAEGTMGKKKAELAYYSVQYDLIPEHSILQLWIACKYNYQIKNYVTVSEFCRKILDLAPTANQAVLQGKVDVETVKKMLRKCTTENSEAEPFAKSSDKTYCVVDMVPIQKMQGVATCVYCQAEASAKHSGTACPICEVSLLQQFA